MDSGHRTTRTCRFEDEGPTGARSLSWYFPPSTSHSSAAARTSCKRYSSARVTSSSGYFNPRTMLQYWAAVMTSPFSTRHPPRIWSIFAAASRCNAGTTWAYVFNVIPI